MKFIENIKNSLGNRKTDKILKSNKRKVKVSNFSNAKSIGIVYAISTTDYQHVVNKYVDYLREEIGFKTIVSLGFCNKNELPSFINKSSLKYKYFTKKELGFNNIGSSKELDEFVKADFDILVDLTNSYNTPIKHIVASSKSKFKIGRFSAENKEFYDFMVDLNSQAPASQFIEQVNAFLKQVKPK